MGMRVMTMGSIVLTFSVFFLVACNGSPSHTLVEYSDYASVIEIEASRYAARDKDYIDPSVEITEQPIYVSDPNAGRQTELLQDPYKVSDNVCETYFVTTQRINPNMPEFTFTRIVGDHSDVHWVYDIPSPVDITIIIKDENGDIIQVISDLSQNARTSIDREIIFADFNFDGYMDMRLVRWHDGGVSSREIDYIWLWDTNELQFVLCEQLVSLDVAGIAANQETHQIETWIRHYDGRTYSFYEFLDNELTLVAYDRLFRIWDDCGHPSHAEMVRTNVVSGEVMIEIYPDGW